MASKSSQTIAYCSKCGIKHTRPVGVRCQKDLNSSAPAPDLHMSASSDMGSNPQPVTTGSLTTITTQNGSKENQGSLDNKLDLILKKMDRLEQKNLELESKLQDKSVAASSASLTHSSPKKSHNCGRQCTKHKRVSSRYISHNDSSDNSEDESFNCSSKRSKQSRQHLSEASVTASSQLSVDFLKNDDMVQRKVRRQLEKLQGRQRTSSGKNLKSGIHRAGDCAVKREIAWPHHHCFPGPNGQLPEYKDLSPLQFSIGFMGCLLEETSTSIRNNMLEYARHLLQDAIETNWTTARHAHMMVLQDIERGKVTWRDSDNIEKIRIRSTARVITTKPTSTSGKGHKHTGKEKICVGYNEGTCKQQGDHVLDNIIYKHACAFCHQEVNRFCHHKTRDCLRRKNNEANKDKKQDS